MYATWLVDQHPATWCLQSMGIHPARNMGSSRTKAQKKQNLSLACLANQQSVLVLWCV